MDAYKLEYIDKIRTIFHNVVDCESGEDAVKRICKIYQEFSLDDSRFEDVSQEDKSASDITVIGSEVPVVSGVIEITGHCQTIWYTDSEVGSSSKLFAFSC